MKAINLFLGCVLFFGAGAVQTHAAEVDTRPAIIFIPGLMGSFLRDVVTKKRVFITIDEATNGHDTLSLFQEQLQTPAGPNLEKDGVLDKIVAIPVIYEIDVYGQMLDSLRAIPDHQVIPFDYDWRLDLHVAVADLDQLVQKLHAQGVKQIDLVGHSGGAWIAAYYAAYGTQEPETAVFNWTGADRIRRMALIGGPFKGSFNIFRDMNRGSTLPMMGHLMPQETISSFPFLYMTLPFMSSRALDQDGKEIPFPVEDVAFWKAHQFGLFDRTDLAPNILQNRASFVSEEIARGRKYMDLIQAAAVGNPPAGLKVLNVVGQGTATTDTAYFVQREHGMQVYFDSDNLAAEKLEVAPLQVDGDGMVSADSATVPKFLRSVATVITSKFAHAKLVEDKDVQKAVADLITGS